MDVARVSVEPSGFRAYEAKGDEQVSWWRTAVSTEVIDDEHDRDCVFRLSRR